jgi:hypothetical protein
VRLVKWNVNGCSATAAGKDGSPPFEIAGAVEAFGDEPATDFGCILGSYSLPGPDLAAIPRERWEAVTDEDSPRAAPE